MTAVILAGGAGSRLGGVTKALLRWQGRSFIEHIIERLKPQVGRIVINAPSPEPYRDHGLTTVADPWTERQGPLAGVLAGLGCSATPFTLIVPSDSPNVSPQLAQRLAAAMDSRCDIAFARCGEENHYLFCLLRTELRQELADFMAEGGRAVRRWFERQTALAVDFSDQPDCFINVNRPGEVKLLP
jgi:molybdopterin-guanine dinucleotide biosynthesis protein A